MTLLRINSHRARERVYSALGADNVTNLCNVFEGHFYEVPDELVAEALAIKSVNRARHPKHALHKPWNMA